MRLREIFNIRIVAAMLVVCAITVSSNTLKAQAQDSTINSITAVEDTAAAVSTAASPSSAPLISTSVDTVARYKNMQPAVVATDHSAAYKSGAYYLLLFILFCVFIAVVGKVMEVYELSRDIQGRRTTFDFRRFQGVLFVVFLLAGLYGVYWSYTVQGPMSMHEPASVHGMDIDFMFKITLIITTIVFVLTHNG